MPDRPTSSGGTAPDTLTCGNPLDTRRCSYPGTVHAFAHGCRGNGDRLCRGSRLGGDGRPLATGNPARKGPPFPRHKPGARRRTRVHAGEAGLARMGGAAITPGTGYEHARWHDILPRSRRVDFAECAPEPGTGRRRIDLRPAGLEGIPVC